MGGEVLATRTEEVEESREDRWTKTTVSTVEIPLPVDQLPQENPHETSSGGMVQAFGVDITKDEAGGEAKLV